MSRQGAVSLPTLLILLVVLGAIGYAIFSLVQDEKKTPVTPPATPPAKTSQTADATQPVETTPPTEIPSDTGRKADPPRDRPAPPVKGTREGVPTELAGIVRDLDGQPLPGATVQLVDFKPNLPGSGKPIWVFDKTVMEETTTDANGRYVFKDKTPTHRLNLRAQAPGYLGQIKDAMLVGRLIDFSLVPGAPVDARVVDEDSGAPIAGAYIRGFFKTADAINDPDQAFRWEEVVRSDADGRFKFDAAPIQEILFVMAHEEYHEKQEKQTVVKGRQNSFVLKLKRGLVLEGLVLDKLEGKPISGMMVQVSNFFIARHSAKTDAEGKFVVKGIELGDQNFMFKGDGYSETREPRKIDVADQFDPAKDRPSPRLVFRVDPCGSAAGIVTSPEGVPVDNARVFVGFQTPLMVSVRAPAEAVTGKDGKFLVKNLNANQTYKLAAHKDGLAIGVSEPVVVGPAEIRDSVEVRLRHGASISGTITNENNLPLAGAVVAVDVPPFADVWFPPRMDIGQPGSRSVVTAPDGRYELKDLWRGSFTFSVEHPEHVALSQQKVMINEPEQQVTQDFQMKIGRFISGSVTATDGQAAEGAIVTATKPWSDHAEATATVDQRGQYKIAGLVKGNYRVQARKAGFSSLPRTDVPADSNGVNFALIECGTVMGFVMSPDGPPATDFNVMLTPLDPANGSFRRSSRPVLTVPVSDPGGLFKVDNVDPGDYSLTVMSAQFGTTEKPHINVPGGGPVDVGAIQLPRGGVIRGRVTDMAGVPITDALVVATKEFRADAGSGEKGEKNEKGEKGVPTEVTTKDGTTVDIDSAGGGRFGKGSPGGGDEMNARPGPSGDYEIRGLQAGAYTLKVIATRHVAPPPDRVAIEEGQELVRDFRMPLGSQLVVTVIDDFSAPVPAASVRLKDAATRQSLDPGSTLRTDAQGRITIPNLRPGKVIMTIERPGFLIKEEEVDIGEGQTIPRTVTFQKI